MIDDVCGDYDFAFAEVDRRRCRNAHANVRTVARKQQHLVGERLCDRDDSGQHVVRNDDHLNSVGCLLACLSNDGHDGFAHITNGVRGQRKAWAGGGQKWEIDRKGTEIDVAVDEDAKNPGGLARLGGIDVGDARMGHLRPHIDHVGGPFEMKVVDKRAVTCKQRRVLTTHNPLTNYPHRVDSSFMWFELRNAQT